MALTSNSVVKSAAENNILETFSEGILPSLPKKGLPSIRKV
jgi:hypothetical protein